MQQGGELAYLLLHDPEYRQVRREHLVEVGRRIRLKPNIDRLVEILERGIEGHRFAFYVVSAAPQEVVRVGARGDRARRAHPRHALRLRRGDRARSAVHRCACSAGYGKVAVLDAAAGASCA